MANEMNFGEAIEALKNGERVSRDGWNGKGMWLLLIAPENAVYRYGGDSMPLQPCIGMRTAAVDMQPGWNASTADVLAEDWGVVS